MTRNNGQGRKANRVVRMPAGKFGHIQKQRMQQRAARFDLGKIAAKTARKTPKG